MITTTCDCRGCNNKDFDEIFCDECYWAALNELEEARQEIEELKDELKDAEQEIKTLEENNETD